MGMSLSGLGSIFGGVMGLFGHDQGHPQRFDLSGVNNELNQFIPQLSQYNLGGQNLQQYQTAMQNTINNPYAAFGLGNTLNFAGAGMDMAAQGIGNANMIGGMVNPLIQAAFDPQHSLYNRTADQVSQQSLASLGQSGLANTPWGQGVQGNTMSNFNIDWQNNLLSRMIAGGGAAEQAGQSAYGLGSSAAMGGAQFGMLPYETFLKQGQDQLGLLSGGAQYGNLASAIPQTQISDWLGQMGQQNTANQNALAQQKENFQENQIFGQDIGRGLYALQNPMYNPYGQNFGTGNFGNFGFGNSYYG